jgi:hypothetical protein
MLCPVQHRWSHAQREELLPVSPHTASGTSASYAVIVCDLQTHKQASLWMLFKFGGSVRTRITPDHSRKNGGLQGAQAGVDKLRVDS